MTYGRAPSAALVVDTNILIGMILGARRRSVWDIVTSRRRLLISVEAVAEVMSVVSHLSDRVPLAAEDAAALLELLEVPNAQQYEEMLADAATMLRNAVASRNGSTADAHVLALAWSSGADIWSHDRDFAGIGWPSWSSANLAAALSEEAAAASIRPARP